MVFMHVLVEWSLSSRYPVPESRGVFPLPIRGNSRCGGGARRIVGEERRGACWLHLAGAALGFRMAVTRARRSVYLPVSGFRGEPCGCPQGFLGDVGSHTGGRNENVIT